MSPRGQHCCCRSRSRSYSSGSYSFDGPDAGMQPMPGFGAMGFPPMWGAGKGGMPFGSDWWKGLAGCDPMGGKGSPWAWPGAAAAAMGALWGTWPSLSGLGGFASSGGGRGKGGGRKTGRDGASCSRSRSDSGGGDKVVERMTFHRSLMGRIIGKQGVTIRDIREKSGARVDAEDVDFDTCEFRIRGQAETVETAKRMILDIVEAAKAEGKGGGRGGSSADVPAEDEVADTLEFPVSATGSIIGTRGSKIMEVRQTSGARVTVEKAENACKVQIFGPPEAVERARVLVTEAAQRDQAQDAAGGGPRDGDKDGESVGGDGSGERNETVSEVLDFVASAAGCIIGTRGAHVAEIREQSGAKVSVENKSDRCKVHIAGTEAQVQRARELVNVRVEEHVASGNATRRHEHEETMPVPISMIGRVIGKGGETVQRFQVESGAKIDINARDRNTDPCPVRLGGSREAVQHAKRLIYDILERTEAQRRVREDQGRFGSGYPDQDPTWGRSPPGPGGYSGGPLGKGYGGEDWPWGQWPPQMSGAWGQMPPLGKGGFPSPWDYPAGDGTRAYARGGGGPDGRGGCGRYDKRGGDRKGGGAGTDPSLRRRGESSGGGAPATGGAAAGVATTRNEIDVDEL